MTEELLADYLVQDGSAKKTSISDSCTAWVF